jgi:hypothetical protein
MTKNCNGTLAQRLTQSRNIPRETWRSCRGCVEQLSARVSREKREEKLLHGEMVRT